LPQSLDPMHSDIVSIVVTSIFGPNKSLLALAEGAKKKGWQFIVVGDVSSPKDFSMEHVTYYDIGQQHKLHFKLVPLCPERHYTRKNIGYLIAISNGSHVIVETDDDNIPNPEFWQPRHRSVHAREVQGSGWINVYKLFSALNIWPRGYPLEEIHSDNRQFQHSAISQQVSGPIHQGLADENPDVDAVFRMTQELPVAFEKNGYFHLGKGVWCPFNSQNTTWFKEAFPLLYLPSFCSFRMTDIWRSFVAQRIAWECDWGLLFHEATVCQERNEHRLIKDFEQELPGYLHNNKIKLLLDGLTLKKGVDQIGNNMLSCYEVLIKNHIISDTKELLLLEAWLNDLKSLQ